MESKTPRSTWSARAASTVVNHTGSRISVMRSRRRLARAGRSAGTDLCTPWNPRGTHCSVPSSVPTPPFQIAALYVDPKGPYASPSKLCRTSGLTTEWYDAERDARTYEGDLPVVAHPPCGPWGRLAWRCSKQPRWAGPHAVEQVRRCGGVLEHPVGSKLFEHMGIPTSPWTPDRYLDDHGGYTIKLPQWHWGHRGEKDTILYIVDKSERYELPPLPDRGCDLFPHPVEKMGKLERRLTPPAMAWWLCQVAIRCGQPHSTVLTGDPDPDDSAQWTNHYAQVLLSHN